MRFTLASENSGNEWSFGLDMTMGEFREWEETQEYQDPSSGLWGNHYEDFIGEMEGYGVLDCGGTHDTELFHSYEITEDDFPIVLEKFREYFKNAGLKIREDI